MNIEKNPNFSVSSKNIQQLSINADNKFVSFYISFPKKEKKEKKTLLKFLGSAKRTITVCSTLVKEGGKLHLNI